MSGDPSLPPGGSRRPMIPPPWCFGAPATTLITLVVALLPQLCTNRRGRLR